MWIFTKAKIMVLTHKKPLHLQIIINILIKSPPLLQIWFNFIIITLQNVAYSNLVNLYIFLCTINLMKYLDGFQKYWKCMDLNGVL